MLREALWPQILKPEDHEHEEGEGTEGCANCRLEEEAGRMSRFEISCWNWYQEYAGGFALESGAAGLDLFMASRKLEAGARRLFRLAIESIHQALERVAAEKAEAARKEK